MSSPKGTSNNPQSFMYKDGESKLVEQSEVEAHMADGWLDNPDGVTTVDAEVTDNESTPEAEADERDDEETGTDEDE